MQWESIIVVVVPVIITVLGNYIAKKIDVRNELNKARENSRIEEDKNDLDRMSKVNDDYYRLYETQMKANEILKEDNRIFKEEMTKKMGDLQGQIDSLTKKLNIVTQESKEKEEGYIITIDKLKEENEELKEENDNLKEENETLKESLKGGD